MAADKSQFDEADALCRDRQDLSGPDMDPLRYFSL